MQTSASRRSANRQRDALVLAHLQLADNQARWFHRRSRGLIERDDLFQVAREALVRATARLDATVPPEPYLKRCIRGALLHHLRDQVRLVRIPRRLHESGIFPFEHRSLDAPHPEGGTWLERLPADAAAEPQSCGTAGAALPSALEQDLELLVEQLPAAQAAAVRLTVLQGGSLRSAARQLGVSATTAMRHRRQGLEHLRKALAA